jgi:hypothetical protein
VRKLFYFILIAGIFISCKKETPTIVTSKTNTAIDSVKSDFDTLDYDMKEFEKRIVDGQDTTELVLNVPVFTAKSVVTDSIDKLVLNEISSIFYNDTLSRPKDMDAICANFISSYNQSLKEDPEFTTTWQGYCTASID